MSCQDNSCYHGTSFGFKCELCAGTGEKSELQIGPFYISMAHFWKKDRHALYVSGEQVGTRLVETPDGLVITTDIPEEIELMKKCK